MLKWGDWGRSWQQAAGSHAGILLLVSHEPRMNVFSWEGKGQFDKNQNISSKLLCCQILTNSKCNSSLHFLVLNLKKYAKKNMWTIQYSLLTNGQVGTGNTEIFQKPTRAQTGRKRNLMSPASNSASNDEARRLTRHAYIIFQVEVYFP